MAREQHDIQVDDERDGQNRVFYIYCHVCGMREQVLDSEDEMLAIVDEHNAIDIYADEDQGEEENA